jgi:hypothetical protein
MPSMVRVREFERERVELHASCTLRLEYAASMNGWVGWLVSFVYVGLPGMPNTVVGTHILTMRTFFIHVLSDCHASASVIGLETIHMPHAALKIIYHTS